MYSIYSFSIQWEGGMRMFWPFHPIKEELHYSAANERESGELLRWYNIFTESQKPYTSQKIISYLHLTIVLGFNTSSQSRHLFRMSIRQPGINRSRSIRRSQRPSQRSADSKVCQSYVFWSRSIRRSQRPSQRSADSKVCHSHFFFLKGTVLRYFTNYLELSVKLDNYFLMCAYVWSILLPCCRDI